MKDFSLLGSVCKEWVKNNESANDRTIKLFSPRIKSSLQMSGVKDKDCISFSLHRKVIGQEFCSICQLLEAIRASRDFTNR